MPTAIILAGPNGAGKTTFASAYLKADAAGFIFINADEIATRLDPALTGPARDMRAGRLMLERLEEAVRDGVDFVVETTLSSALYANRIENWRTAGYEVVLIYLRLPDAETSLQRVRRRAEAGGHSIAEADVMRRFGRSLNLLETVYKDLVDDWLVYDSVNRDVVLSERKSK